MRCPASTWLNLAPGAGFTVDNGSTLRLESGSRMDVGSGAVLRVKRGGKLELMGGSVLNVLQGGQVIIEEDWPPANYGRLVYHQGARINLEGSNAVLEFAGVLDIQPNAVFTVGRSSDPGTTLGLVKFTNSLPVSNNVAAGANSRFILRSTSTNNRILHVEQESLYGPATLVEFTLDKAQATLANHARIVPPVSNGCAINFTDATVTSPTGVRNTHRGVRLNGQVGVNLYKSTFSKGAYGVYSYNTNLGNGLAPYQCSFIDCGTGLYNYDKGIAAVNCKFDQCGNGLVCQQQSQTGYLTDCQARYNTGTGIFFQGSATLKVVNAGFDRNAVGLALDGATAVVSCGTVSNNASYGFALANAATLRMDDVGSGHDPVTAKGNRTTVRCDLANNVYLDYGHNSLKPLSTGTQSVLNGTFLCQPYANPQPARKNNWTGAVGVPLTSAEYYITSCGGSIGFSDPSSVAESSCGQSPMLVPGGGDAASLFADCPDCGTVGTVDGMDLPLNAALLAALATADLDSLPDNELIAMEAFSSILENAMAAPNAEETYLLGEAYVFLMESFGDALAKGQLSPATDNVAAYTYTGLVLDVQDGRLAGAVPGVQDDFIFYTTMVKAQALRASGRLNEALAILNTVPVPAGDLQQAYWSSMRCYTQTEWAVLSGTLEWDEVEAAMENCGKHGAQKRMAFSGTDDAEWAAALPSVRPNPATREVLVQGWPGTEHTLLILDLAGRPVAPEVRFKEQATVPVHNLSPGTYLCRFMDAEGHSATERLVVGR